MSPSTDIITKNSKSQKVSSHTNISTDEIPLVLFELNESALAFIAREQFEKALLLL
jgi:hypothetical protein